jgi:hypothetical protein
MNTKHMLIAAVLAGVFAPAIARADAGQLQEGGQRALVRERRVVDGADAAIMQAFEQASFGGPLVGMRVKPIKNAPYSAEAVSEQVQTLANGNQITHKTMSMSYRDSAGRTRQESRTSGGELRRVTIHDPVERITYVLNAMTKIATKIGPRPRMTPAEREQARAQAEEMRKDGGPARQELIIKPVERGDGGEAARRVRENVRIQVSKGIAEGGPMPGMERIGAVIAGAFGDLTWSRKAVTKDLGSKEIDGVKAQGKLRSYEIPAGAIGNRDAILVATETWYSPELQVTLLSRSSDPRSGERSYRLVGLKREEPPAALFAVPSDYTVKDAVAVLRKPEQQK